MQPDISEIVSHNTDSTKNGARFFSADLSKLVEISERRQAVSHPDSEKFYEVLSPDGIHFLHCEAFMHNSNKIYVENPNHFFHLIFVIKSPCNYLEMAAKKTFATIANYEYNLFYFPPNSLQIEWNQALKAESFVLNLAPEFLEKYLPADHPVSKKLMVAIKNNKTLKAAEQNLPLTPHIMGILLDILNCPLEKIYKRMFLKAKVIELLSVLLSQMDEFKELRNKAGLRKDDITKMQDARERLHQNLQSPCSLIDLAHQVGTNENYLKKHFKQLYGNTVYGYIQELRMQQAKNMLKENMDLPEIAQAIGYKNVNHFTAAFKKYFGYTPHSLKE